MALVRRQSTMRHSCHNVALGPINTNGPDYLKPSAGSSSAATATAVLPPRIMRLGLRYTF
jgi:hypothetical protein